MNKIRKIIIALASVFCFILLGGSAFAQPFTRSGAEMFSPPQTYFNYRAEGWNMFEAGWLIGQGVYSPLGGELGQIEDLMIDRTDGHVALVILSGVQGFGAKFVAAPFSALERTGEDTFQLNFNDQYISMPSAYFEDPYAYQLYRYRSIVGLSTIPPTIDPLWADSVYRFYGQAPYWTEGRTVPPDIMSYRTARTPILESLLIRNTAPVLMGATVQSKNGKAEARIDDLVIDSKDGRVALLVLDRVLGRGDMQVAVPFGELSMSGNAFVLNTTQKQLTSAPSFNELADMNNLRYAENVYKYFGQHPYWTE